MGRAYEQEIGRCARLRDVVLRREDDRMRKFVGDG